MARAKKHKLGKVEYETYLNSSRWQERRTKALVRDDYSCRGCGSKERLHVHHKTYARLGNENIDDLLTLCYQCHMGLHGEIEKKRSAHEIKKKNRKQPGTCRTCGKGFMPRGFPKGGGWYCSYECLAAMKKKRKGKPERENQPRHRRPMRVVFVDSETLRGKGTEAAVEAKNWLSL